MPPARINAGHRAWERGLGLALLALGLAAAARAQAAPPFKFHARVREVLVQVTVLGKKNRPVNNLTENDFQVLENGVPQKLDYFEHSDAPVSVGLLIDNSGSMSNKRAAVEAAALAFIHDSNPQDEIFVVNFNEIPYLDAPFTNQISVLQHALDRIESSGGTALYDATVASLDELSLHGKNQKRALLIVTDGEDDDSEYTLEQTIRAAEKEKNAPMIYCIGILAHDNTGGARKRAMRALKALSKATGGLAYFPKHLNQVAYYTRLIASEMRQQYTMTYVSNQHTPGYRSIKVLVHPSKKQKLRVIARSGYYPHAAGADVASSR